MIENVVVVIIVGAVVLLAGRSVYRTVSGKSGGCGCGNIECGMTDSCADSSHGTCGQESEVTPDTKHTRR